LQRIVAPIGRDSAEFTILALAGAPAATEVLRGGDASRDGGAAAAIAADDARVAAARALSGCTLDAGARSAPGAALRLSAGVGVRCDAGMAAARRGGGGELGGRLSAGAVAEAGGVGCVPDCVPDCAAAACATPTKIMSAASRELVMVSPS
jgi:hypothetical protein